MDLRYFLATRIFKSRCSYMHYGNELYITIRRIFSERALKVIIVVSGVILLVLNAFIFGAKAYIFENIKPVLEVLLKQSEQGKELLPLISWNGWVFGVLLFGIPVICSILVYLIDEYYYEDYEYYYQNQKVEDL